MIKNILIVILIVGFAGCAQKQHSKPQPDKKVQMQHKMMHKKMFQSVNPDQAVLVQKGDQKMHCVRCGMNLVKFYKTSHIAQDGNEKRQYCSLHCLVEHLNEGAELKNPQVIDVSTLKPIPVLQAYYVVGSDVHGTMSRVSKYAFGTLEAAKAFQAKHGGNIMDFRGALEEAKKDFR